MIKAMRIDEGLPDSSLERVLSGADQAMGKRSGSIVRGV